MKKLKLSPWHSGDVKPIHVGLYQVFYKDKIMWCYWNPFWGWAYENKKWALSKKWRGPEGASQEKQWRGILK
ncbi:MAG TPA: hypothetical protein VFM18_15315 [Methanosarcina sp.]|nr:hypothetical protein [Methanosarcina sp.]